jgi:hypothetical protein
MLLAYSDLGSKIAKSPSVRDFLAGLAEAGYSEAIAVIRGCISVSRNVAHKVKKGS